MEHLVVDDVPEQLRGLEAFLRASGFIWTEHITVLLSACEGSLTAWPQRFAFLRQLPRLRQLTVRTRGLQGPLPGQHPLNVA